MHLSIRNLLGLGTELSNLSVDDLGGVGSGMGLGEHILGSEAVQLACGLLTCSSDSAQVFNLMTLEASLDV